MLKYFFYYYEEFQQDTDIKGGKGTEQKRRVRCSHPISFSSGITSLT